MQPKQMIQTKEGESPSGPIFVEAEKLFEQVKELSRSVARRAYQFFEVRGGANGNDLDDWFRAESELLRPVAVEIKEAESKISVRAEVPGFAAGEIKINVEPNLLVISGKSESAVKEANEQTVFSEFHSNQFSRQLPLPSEVDPAKATAVLKNGILEIELVRTRATCGRQG